MNTEKELQITINKIDETYGKITVLNNGLVNGRLIEIYDDESLEKITLTLKVISEAQKLGAIAVVIGVENSFNSNYAEQLGVDIENLVKARTDNKEQAMEIAENFILSGVLDIIVIIDTVSELSVN